MMSSEEESDSHADTADCPDDLLKKQKRARQRVDAGEPRNSYSCVPNYVRVAPHAFTFMSGVYGAVFSPGRPHFGGLGAAPPHTMLNELLGRPPKQELHERKKHLASPDNNNVLATNNNQTDTNGRRSSNERHDWNGSRSPSSLASQHSSPNARAASPLVAPKQEPEDTLDVKRARVETIVSTMRSSPAPTPIPQVNGCKKRKLYQPQQHDRPRAASSPESSDSECSPVTERPPIVRKLVEKNALESQLRSMQDQLAEMQNKYLQLCGRVDRDTSIDDDHVSTNGDIEKPETPPPEPPPPQYCLPHEQPHAVYHKLFLERAVAPRALPHHMVPRQSQPSSPSAPPPSAPPAPSPAELAERLDALRGAAAGAAVSGAELEGLAEVLKSEITASLASLVDSIVTRFVHQRRLLGKRSEAAAAAAEQLNKDLMLASRLLERKSPGNGCRERAAAPTQHVPLHRIPEFQTPDSGNALAPLNGLRGGGARPQQFSMHEAPGGGLQARPPAAAFQPPKPPPLYSQPWNNEREMGEQHEALSLVVTPKKKRHKVTDTRITPRTVSRLLGEPGPLPASPAADSPSPRPPPASYPPQLVLPTSVAITNPSLHESQVFSPYSPFFGAGSIRGGNVGMRGGSPHGHIERDSPPLPHAPALLHPALLAAAHRASVTPDYLRHHHHQLAAAAAAANAESDPHSDCNSTDLTYDGLKTNMSFSMSNGMGNNNLQSSTLTPMHLRKAKLMFFWVRYPSSAVLKMYFPDIMFNKNNTAQLVKWFSNFREFYYIQMEKYARQAISEGMKSPDELQVAADSELYRVLNLHYNRNNHIEVPPNFRYVIEQTLREFYRAIQGGKDTEQSWKKSIYKIISRLDDPVPEYFKSPNFLEQLE